jgi:hypothetical protein
MRSAEKIPSIPKIMVGLIEMCAYLSDQMDLENSVMYELGSFAGESTAELAKFFGTVHAVDPWVDPCGAPSIQEVEGSFDERAKLAGNIVKHKCGSLDIVTSVTDESLDFVYIDAGTHSYEEAVRDITGWWPKVRKGGFLGGHDYPIQELNAKDTFPGVKRAVTEILRDMELKLFPDTSWVVRKP